MKIKSSFLLAGFLALASCVNNLKNRQADILFEALETNLEEPSDSLLDTIKSAFAHFNVLTLDTAHQKEFWFNAYLFNVETLSKSEYQYLNYNTFMNSKFELANEIYTTKELIEKIKSYQDNRMLVCIDFLTTTSSRTRKQIIKSDVEEVLDSISTELINDQSFVRVKKDIKQVFYPQHFEWLLGVNGSKEFILKYHKDPLIAKYMFRPYPFSSKLRN